MPWFCDEDGIDKVYNSPNNDQLKTFNSLQMLPCPIYDWINLGSLANFEPLLLWKICKITHKILQSGFLKMPVNISLQILYIYIYITYKHTPQNEKNWLKTGFVRKGHKYGMIRQLFSSFENAFSIARNIQLKHMHVIYLEIKN